MRKLTIALALTSPLTVAATVLAVVALPIVAGGLLLSLMYRLIREECSAKRKKFERGLSHLNVFQQSLLASVPVSGERLRTEAHVTAPTTTFDANRRYYVKKGTWPLIIAGNNTTYYVVDRHNPVLDDSNPEYFTKRSTAAARANKLNKESANMTTIPIPNALVKKANRSEHSYEQRQARKSRVKVPSLKTLNRLDVSQLVSTAQLLGVSANSRWKKETLIKHIRAKA